MRLLYNMLLFAVRLSIELRDALNTQIQRIQRNSSFRSGLTLQNTRGEQ